MYMSLIKSFVNFVAIIALFIVFQGIMSFLAIDISSYLIFLAWFIALILFYYILPSDYKFFI